MAELKTDMAQEIDEMDSRMIKPAVDAKEFLKPMKKAIKAREDRKVSLNHFDVRTKARLELYYVARFRAV